MTVTLRGHQVAVEVYSDTEGLNPPENIFMQPVSSDQINMSVIDVVCHCQPQKRCTHVARTRTRTLDRMSQLPKIWQDTKQTLFSDVAFYAL